MYISRIYIKNFRNFQEIDIPFKDGVTCIIGENNTGKTNLFHALRLVLDNSLPSTYRHLQEEDLFSKANFLQPNQVIISIEFKDFEECINSEALVCTWKVEDLDVARLSFLFRPRLSFREMHTNNEEIDRLSLETDYEWRLVGGGHKDPREIVWHENFGSATRFGDLQAFKLEFLKDLRDVLQDLQRDRVSPLRKLIRIRDSDVPKDKLIEKLRSANESISGDEVFQSANVDIQRAFDSTVGEAYEDMRLSLGMVEPTYAAILRSLKVLFRSDLIQDQDFDISRNGLGLNNLIYIIMILEAFEQRISAEDVAGQLLLIEEPEAHLHPQLQRALFEVLAKKSSQVILSSHSTHISSQAPLESLVSFTNSSSGTIASRLALSEKLEDKEIKDLERYLDATRSTLLFARKVILVEGPAELFLIPKMIEAVKKINLDRYGISVIPIYGTHFDSYAKLFASDGLPKKCAIITDGDQCPEDLSIDQPEDSLYDPPRLPDLNSTFVKVFGCQTTFERAITNHDSLEMLIATLSEYGANDVKRDCVEAKRELDQQGDLGTHRYEDILRPVRKRILNQAKSKGKARFAQVASKHTQGLKRLPEYIDKALEWLRDD